MMHVAIITVDFNSHQETHDCLASLKKLILPKDVDINIIVVDNASKAPFVLNETEKKDGITVLRSEENLGFSGGNNVGIQTALKNGNDAIMLINNDTYVEKNVLKEFISTMEKYPKAGAIVPKIYFAKGHEFHKDRYKNSELGNILWYAGGGFDWNNVVSYHRGVDEVDTGQYDIEKFVEFATGCCIYIKKEVFEKIGMFNNNYYLYVEDADLSMRIKKAGFSIVYQPKAIIWHITAASGGGSGAPLHDYYLTRNKLIFGFSYAPLRSKLALFRESIRLLFTGREWQKKGVIDFYSHNLGKGSFGN